MLYGINPLMTNGLSHPYHLNEPSFDFRLIGSLFSFLFHISMKFDEIRRSKQNNPISGLFHLPTIPFAYVP